MENQKRLFHLIGSILPPHVNLANEVADLLDINVNTAYERIGCRVPLKLKEAVLLCRHYRISMDKVINHDSGNIPFHYVPLAVDDPRQYHRYMLELKSSMERLAAGSDSELIFAADDIPVFHFMPYPELTYFKLYAWNRAMNRAAGSYEQFLRSADRLELRDTFRQISVAYGKVPSAEIWTEETINPILSLLAHYRDFGKFDHPDTLPMLREQLMALLENMEDWATTSRKGADSEVPYRLYLCPVKPGSSIMLTRCDGEQLVRMKLYTINSIATDDRRLCGETQHWMAQTISKSTCLSGSSEITRTLLFSGMKEKVSALTV